MTAWLLKLATGNPLTLLWIAGAIALAAGGAGGTAGWHLNGWRLGAEIADTKVQLANTQARVDVLEPANAKCAADVAHVRQAFKDLEAAETKRAAAAADAVARAQAKAQTFADAANRIMNAQRPAAGQECPAIINEEADYVRARQTR